MLLLYQIFLLTVFIKVYIYSNDTSTSNDQNDIINNIKTDITTIISLKALQDQIF
jgi:hypothetical protein